MTVLVTGAGGFIGGHLVAQLLADGKEVRAVDVKPEKEWYQRFDDADNLVADCSLLDDARRMSEGTTEIYNLAADMGGMGFIENNKAECMLSVLTSTHMLMAAREAGTQRFFYSSSACVYAGDKQTDPNVTALKESDAYPADPEDGYGWEKLFSERMARHFREDFGIETRVARYHNVYGPEGTFEGGREKAPAALSRKIAEAKLSGNHTIDVWGDGEQSRSFMYIDDCVRGTKEILAGDNIEPVNLGSSELVTINQMIGILEEIAGITVTKQHDLTAPQGVRGRNSDNTMFHDIYGWEPSISLHDGLEKTYAWIFDQLSSR
ncbi:NAD dependent epimerase/dehydratase family protein [Aeromicrobium marinum DSM 15272]|uniref:NAD dependent epimerase/dehydratase family protein n=1 Tax=Aeromicrobium marinum DSM 15272 TaxID=585531 RepID=E2SFH0_9ACTN|nr:NAD-dependent epimerase/dehydratase family protein [Aeromicrobium marinum]EFQ82071.1 NAD dependent epimerase/dehydratase family protein [Aeromicrobium marinum DSM 15272]